MQTENINVDDLIIEYMITKLENGYNPYFSNLEFLEFLKQIENKIKINDITYDIDKIFKKFFKRKHNEWTTIQNTINFKRISTPHMDIIKDKNDSFIIKANYLLNSQDYKHYFNKNDLEKINLITRNYLKSQPKRNIDDICVNQEELQIGKDVAITIINDIWLTHIDELIKFYKWPRQCKDINKYLIINDLAPLINLKSIKKELLLIYNDIAKKIAIMYKQDKKLKITSNFTQYLAKANFDLISKDYEEIFNSTYDIFKKQLDIDLEKTFTTPLSEARINCDKEVKKYLKK